MVPCELVQSLSEGDLTAQFDASDEGDGVPRAIDAEAGWRRDRGDAVDSAPPPRAVHAVVGVTGAYDWRSADRDEREEGRRPRSERRTTGAGLLRQTA